jgi:hypothetical protein
MRAIRGQPSPTRRAFATLRPGPHRRPRLGTGLTPPRPHRPRTADGHRA